MPIRARRSQLRSTVASFLFVAAAACGDKPATDPRNREIPWAYGPMNSTASAEHMRGTGREGGAALAKGWRCHLQDGKRLIVQPYQLAADHPLFGKVALGVSLFDKAGKQIGDFVSPTLTPQAATFTFAVEEAVAAQLWDLVVWYRKV